MRNLFAEIRSYPLDPVEVAAYTFLSILIALLLGLVIIPKIA